MDVAFERRDLLHAKISFLDIYVVFVIVYCFFPQCSIFQQLGFFLVWGNATSGFKVEDLVKLYEWMYKLICKAQLNPFYNLLLKKHFLLSFVMDPVYKIMYLCNK